MEKAILIAFSINSGKFESVYERNKFFRNLYGWKQIIRKKEIHGKKRKLKIYTYRRNGLLDEIPHIRVDQSSFIVPEDFFERILSFLREWEDKVIWKTFEVLINDEIKERLKKW